jgi:integrase
MLDFNLPPEPGGFNPTQRMRKPAGPGKHRIRVLCAMGANMKIRFTKANIDALEPPPKGEIFAWCSDKPGWGVRILASGRKSWVVQFRDKTGKSRRHTIGDLRIVPLTIAERRASELLSSAKLGIDLLGEEKAKRERRTADAERSVGAMVAAYCSEAETRRKRSFSETRRYLEVHWKPIHLESAETISRHQIVPELRKIAAERGPISANRARSALSGMFTWAITHGRLRREASPTTYLPKWAEHARERVLSLEELRAVWEAAPAVNPIFGRIIQLLILTGCRKSEIASLRWPEVNIAKALITLPAERVKSNRSVTIPLSTAAVEIIEAAPHINDALVFVNCSAWSHVKKALDAQVMLPPWVIHDIRRSCRSHWIDGEHGLGLDVHLCELLLGHALPGIIGVYDRGTRLAERRRALERWAELITGKGAGDTVVEAAGRFERN